MLTDGDSVGPRGLSKEGAREVVVEGEVEGTERSAEGRVGKAMADGVSTGAEGAAAGAGVGSDVGVGSGDGGGTGSDEVAAAATSANDGLDVASTMGSGVCLRSGLDACDPSSFIGERRGLLGLVEGTLAAMSVEGMSAAGRTGVVGDVRGIVTSMSNSSSRSITASGSAMGTSSSVDGCSVRGVAVSEAGFCDATDTLLIAQVREEGTSAHTQRPPEPHPSLLCRPED